MKPLYPPEAKRLEQFLLQNLETEEIKILRRRIEDLLRKNKSSLLIVAAVLADHEFLDIEKQ